MTDDRAWLQAMLDVEAALARAEARLGLMPEEDAEAIAAACRADRFDPAALGRDGAASGNPVVPLVRALRLAVGEPSAGRIHLGATSQDVLDTAAMLVAREALDIVLDDLGAAADLAAGLASRHRSTLMPARTLLQHAVPTTFGLKAAGWLGGLDAASDQLRRVRDTRLAVQLGGAGGTLGSMGPDGAALVATLAGELGLATPVMPWHTDRTRIGELAGALGVTAGAIGKPALDIVLLAQTEVAEVADARHGTGGSSTLPQKRNPVAAVCALAGARRAPGLVATLLSVMPQEHERGAGGWHAEWRPLVDLLVAVGSATAWLREALEHLDVHPDRMRADLDLTDGLVLAERYAAVLAPLLGHDRADGLVGAAADAARASGRSLREELADRPEVASRPGLLALVDQASAVVLDDPAGYLGSTDAFIDGALAAHARSSGGRPA